MYTVKWIIDNLGISRKTLRYYEEKGLLKDNRNIINNYREYNEEDINKIWSIKLLTGIGFTANEIKEIMDNPKFDFYEYLGFKIKELESKIDVNNKYLNFAKTIKLTGRIPTTEIGSIKFEDFINYSIENWNFVKYTKDVYEFANLEDSININDDLIRKAMESYDQLKDIINMQLVAQIDTFLYIIASLKETGVESSVVKTNVLLFYFFIEDHYKELGLKERLTREEFIKYLDPCLFQDGDIYKLNIKKYGEDGVKFISEALKTLIEK